jgi:hypothetical protein
MTVAAGERPIGLPHVAGRLDQPLVAAVKHVERAGFNSPFYS